MATWVETTLRVVSLVLPETTTITRSAPYANTASAV